jgi:hypothetical protein
MHDADDQTHGGPPDPLDLDPPLSAAERAALLLPSAGPDGRGAVHPTDPFVRASLLDRGLLERAPDGEHDLPPSWCYTEAGLAARASLLREREAALRAVYRSYRPGDPDPNRDVPHARRSPHCPAEAGGFSCTRLAGHRAPQHVAGTGRLVAAVWTGDGGEDLEVWGGEPDALRPGAAPAPRADAAHRGLAGLPPRRAGRDRGGAGGGRVTGDGRPDAPLGAPTGASDAPFFRTAGTPDPFLIPDDRRHLRHAFYLRHPEMDLRVEGEVLRDRAAYEAARASGAYLPDGDPGPVPAPSPAVGPPGDLAAAVREFLGGGATLDELAGALGEAEGRG